MAYRIRSAGSLIAAFFIAAVTCKTFAAPTDPALPPATGGAAVNTPVAIPASPQESQPSFEPGATAIGAAPSAQPTTDDADKRKAMEIAQRLGGGTNTNKSPVTGAAKTENRSIAPAPAATTAAPAAISTQPVPAASPAPASAALATTPAAPAGEGAKTIIPPASPQERLGLGAPSSSRRAASDAVSTNTGSISWIATTGGALALVIGLILLLRAGFLKLSGQSAFTRGNAVVEVLSRVTLHPKSRLLLVRAGSRLLLLGETPQGINTLTQIDSPEEIAAILQTLTAGQASSSTRAFQALLDRMGSDYDDRLRLADEGRDDRETHVDRARNGVDGLLSRVRSLGVRGGEA